MSVLSDLAYKELININSQSRSVEEFFRITSKELLELGFVKETFFNAINEREKVFPTGLQLEHIAVAIPHTDIEHIIKPFVYINKLNKYQLEFIQMGTDDVIIKPEYIFILGIKDPKGQVELLSTLIEFFNNKDFVTKLKNSKTENEVYNLLIKN